TGVGAKLKARWLREVVVNGAEARPYLVTRMPRFGTPATESLAGWLKQSDPALPAPEIRIPEADKPRQAGRELAGSKGFNCVACHVFRGRSAAPIRALDLTTMTDRLEAGWFHRYLESPRRFSPLTIMPDFWPGGQSPLTEVLGGDPARQREALWQYLAEGPEAGEPQGLVLEPLVITVGEEAVMLRRAYPGIGKRGIGVGYPAGIHLAFDAGQLRLGSIWSGGFIDASPLWRGQGAGQARLLGRDRVDFPAGPAFAILDSDTAPWPAGAEDSGSDTRFLGYRLDTRRRPTFRYQIGALQVDDRFVDLVDPKGRPYFERHLEFPGSNLPANLFFRVA
ncbi:MAG: cytochrome c1, partial [Verrucomicrobiota bacterium]